MLEYENNLRAGLLLVLENRQVLQLTTDHLNTPYALIYKGIVRLKY